MASNDSTEPSNNNTHPLSTKVSVISVVCRICYDSEKSEELITPCQCKGTVAFVHRSCLETWLGESNTTTCELCHQVFHTERTPRYTTGKSIWYWLCSPRASSQGVRGDIMACSIITPLAIVITYVCLFSSEYYSQKKFSNVPAARWTSVSLLFMIGIMLIGYYLWVYAVIRMHARHWYMWWQRSCDVRYIPSGTVITTCNTVPTLTNVPTNTPNEQVANHSSIEMSEIDSDKTLNANKKLEDKGSVSSCTIEIDNETNVENSKVYVPE